MSYANSLSAINTNSSPSQTIFELRNFLSKFAKGTKVILVGHSYGGWLAMHAAFQLTFEYQIDGLITIDPISPNDCGPGDISGNYLQSTLGVNGHTVGCTNYPSKMKFYFKQILSGTKYWVNIYQTDYQVLHSSRIFEADLNVKVHFPKNSYWNYEPHKEIDNDSRTWNLIKYISSLETTTIFQSNFLHAY